MDQITRAEIIKDGEHSEVARMILRSCKGREDDEFVRCVRDARIDYEVAASIERGAIRERFACEHGRRSHGT